MEAKSGILHIFLTAVMEHGGIRKAKVSPNWIHYGVGTEEDYGN